MKTKQSIPKELRYTVRDFDKEFPNDDACLKYMAEQRWPGGVTYCEKCQQERKHHRINGRTAYSCAYCGTQIYPLAGTIFEKTTTPLKTWFYAMFLMGSTRCGISAKQIQRETGVTYKTAWRIFHQSSQTSFRKATSNWRVRRWRWMKPTWAGSAATIAGGLTAPIQSIGQWLAWSSAARRGRVRTQSYNKRCDPQESSRIYQRICYARFHYLHR